MELQTMKSSSSSKQVEFVFGGMTCSMCSNAVQKALMDMPGVISVHVLLSTNMATIEYHESNACTVDILKETIENMNKYAKNGKITARNYAISSNFNNYNRL